VERSARRDVIGAEADVAIERWIADGHRGAPTAFPTDPPISLEQFLRYAEFHGVVALLYVRLASASASGLPGAEWADALADAARRQTLRELLLRQELAEILDAASTRGIRALLLKGAALAYSLYPEAGQRGRVDTDLLIALDDKTSMSRLLEERGYVGDVIAAQHWATSERTFTKTTTAGVTSRLDIHWRINNSPLFWHAELEYARLMMEAQPLPALHPDAWCPDTAALLLHACIHRASHAGAPMYFDSGAIVVTNRLIWLYDIHLLAAAMTQAGWTSVVAMAARMGLRRICHSALVAAAERFGTVLPAGVIDQLARPDRESAPDLFNGARWQIRLREFRALPSTQARMGWLREQLLPRSAYMRARYSDRPRSPLPLLYLRRLLPSRRAS
jgi:hypothetical protein